MNRLHNATGTYDLCRCYFSYDENYWYFYVLGHSDTLMLGVEEDDFILDGFQIRKISDLKKIEIKDDLCVKINEKNGLLRNVEKPDVNLSSWQSAFASLLPLGRFVIVQNEKFEAGEAFYCIGTVKKPKKTSVVIAPFDADGNWLEDIEIPYSKITSVTFGDRYSETWQKYMEGTIDLS
ncbi:MAG: hypothetical protein J1E00_01405 [Oscillospiraceae bacterium]|nr:hypothetical protein [Oscillospiraceae bacterium]